MANAFTNFIGQVFNSPAQLKDYAHASRLYVDDYFRLAPKSAFLYYVVFNINRNGNPLIQQFLAKHGNEVGLLVKSTDLPRFRISTETVNQYNRKSVVQTKLEYQPVSMVFHDDNNNTTTRLWNAYYRYYIADGKDETTLSRPIAFGDTKYKKIGTNINESTSYGLNNGQTGAFFDSIEIYQLSRKEFTSFILLNPLISEWSHDKMDQSESRLLENRMTVAYETVLYRTGKIKRDSPTGFATVHYDTTPSPLSIFGGGNNSLFGPGGIIPGAAEILGGAGDTSPLGLFRTARGVTNLVRNAKNVNKASILSEAFSILNKSAQTGKLPFGLGSATGSNPTGVNFPTFTGGFQQRALSANLVGSLDIIGGDNNQPSVEIRTTLPSELPTDSQSLTVLRTEQQLVAVQLSNQINVNQSIKQEFDPKILAAQNSGNTEELDNLYNQLDAIGYTDPVKLEENLSKVNQNILSLNNLIIEAKSVESPTGNLEVDNVPLGESPENFYDVTNNPDLNTTPATIYRNNGGSTTEYYG